MTVKTTLSFTDRHHRYLSEKVGQGVFATRSAAVAAAIEQMMQDDFASLVLEYIRESMKHQTRMGSPAEVASLEERLESVVVGLIHQGKLNFMSALRESLMPWMKSLVREVGGGEGTQEEGNGVEEESEGRKGEEDAKRKERREGKTGERAMKGREEGRGGGE